MIKPSEILELNCGSDLGYEHEVCVKYSANHSAYEIAEELLSRNLKDDETVEFYTEYHLDRDEITAYFVLKNSNGGDTSIDYELSDEEAFTLVKLQQEYLKKHYGIDSISDFGKAINNIERRIEDIGDFDYHCLAELEKCEIEMTFSMNDTFIREYGMDVYDRFIPTSDTVREFQLYKDLLTGNLELQEYVCDFDNEFEDYAVTIIEKDKLASLCYLAEQEYERRYHEPIEKWESDILSDYEKDSKKLKEEDEQYYERG